MAVARWALVDAANLVAYVVESDGAPPVLPSGVKSARDTTGFAVSPGDTFDGLIVTPRTLSQQEIAAANTQALQAKALLALNTNATFQAIGSPTNAQVLAQTQALTKQVNALIRLIGGSLLNTTGT